MYRYTICKCTDSILQDFDNFKLHSLTLSCYILDFWSTLIAPRKCEVQQKYNKDNSLNRDLNKLHAFKMLTVSNLSVAI